MSRIRLTLSEKFEVGIVLLAALPLFLSVIFGVLALNDLLHLAAIDGAATQEIREGLRFFYLLLLGLWLFSVVGSGFLVFYFCRKFTRPIEFLAKIAAEIAGGKSRSIPYCSGENEVAGLYNSIRSLHSSQLATIEKLKKANEVKSEFISIASHQLRTPLSSIKWLIEILLENTELDKGQKEKLQNIYESNERLISLVNDLLNVTRLEAGKITANRQLSNIQKLIDVTTELLAPEANEKGIKVMVSRKTVIEDIKLDSLLLSEAFKNILDNAIAYSPNDTIVDIVVSKEGQSYVIAVHNEGPIIPEMEHDKLFTKFHRGVVAQNLRPRGSGLGLFIAKLAVEANGGSIWFDSPAPEGHGTTFYISVPIE